jgi:hypothetical protein
MKTLNIIINPCDVKSAHVHLDTLTVGSFIIPNLFKIHIPNDEVQPLVDSIEYLLCGLDFCIADEFYLTHYN